MTQDALLLRVLGHVRSVDLIALRQSDPETYNLLAVLAREDGAMVIDDEPPFSAQAITQAKSLGLLKISPSGDIIGSLSEEYWLTRRGRALFGLPPDNRSVLRRFLTAIGFG